MIVVDTNVLAYFVIQSEQTELAEEVLRKDGDWAAPLLWQSELRNVFLLYIRRGTLDLRGALEKFALAKWIIGEREFEIEADQVLKIAIESGCTAYGCEFVSLAERLNIPFVTSDKKVLAAFPKVSLSMNEFVA